MPSNILKELYWELRDRKKRFHYINAFVYNIPGDLGMYIRAKVIPKYFKQAGKNTSIWPGTRYRGAECITVGDNVTIGIDNFFQASGGLTLDDHVLLGPGVKIWTTNHKFADLDVPIKEQGYEKKPVYIGKNVWIGANCFIMPGVELPTGCIISAGAVVGAKKYPEYSIIAGNPARVIGNRKKDQSKESG